MENEINFQQEYDRLDIEAGKYNRKEFDLVYDIISEMVKGRKDVGDNGNLAFPLVKGKIVDKAIEKAGFSNDEIFISDFKKYREIEQRARDLRVQGHKQVCKLKAEGYSILEIQQKTGIHHSNELQDAMEKAVLEAKKKYPYFPFPTPFDDLQINDESIDEIIGANGYKVSNGYLKPYYDELLKYHLDDLLERAGFSAKDLFLLIYATGKLIIDSNIKPLMIQNRIVEILKMLNELKGTGIMIQVLYLQGVLKWFAGCDISEGDENWEEAQNLCDWVYERFEESLVNYEIIIEKNENSSALDSYLSTIEAWNRIVENTRAERYDSERIEESEPEEKDSSTDDTINYSDLLKDLKKYIDGISASDFKYLIEHHSLKNGISKARWLGKPVDAHRFATFFNMTIKRWNNCFTGLTKRDGTPRQLSHNDKNDTYSVIHNILGKYFMK